MGKVNSKDATGRTVTLTRVRASFAESLQVASLPKKNKDPSAKPTHGANWLLETGSPDFESNQAATISAMKAAAREFKRPEDWYKTLMADDPKQCALRKGERFKTDKGEIYKGYEGNLVLASKGPAAGKSRPQIRDRYKKVIEDVTKINEIVYNGSYCDVIISFYGTDNGGTARLTCSVEAVRSHQEGERLGGGGIYVDDDDFDTLEEDDSFDSGPKTGAASSGSLLDL
jgi:hypothetical protein